MRKNLLIMLALVLMPYYLTAQENNPKIHELGLNFAGFNSFGIRYRTGTESTLLRLTLSSINATTRKNKSGSDQTSTFKSSGIGFNIGFEKSKPLSSNLSFYYGADLLTSFSGSSSNYESSGNELKERTFSSGAGLVLGFAYKFNNDISLSAEFVPSILYSYTKYTTTSSGEESVSTSSGFDYGLSSTGANLTLSFRLGKKD
jgi:hypothetical protein